MVGETMLLRQRLKESGLSEWKVVWRMGFYSSSGFDQNKKIINIEAETYSQALRLLNYEIDVIKAQETRFYSESLTKLF